MLAQRPGTLAFALEETRDSTSRRLQAAASSPCCVKSRSNATVAWSTVQYSGPAHQAQQVILYTFIDNGARVHM